MCHAMDEIARYVMASISNSSTTSEDSYSRTPNCTVGPHPCNTSLCTFSDGAQQSLSIFQCLDPPQVRVTDTVLGFDVTTAFTVHDDVAGVTVVVEDRGGAIIGLEVLACGGVECSLNVSWMICHRLSFQWCLCFPRPCVRSFKHYRNMYSAYIAIV